MEEVTTEEVTAKVTTKEVAAMGARQPKEIAEGSPQRVLPEEDYSPAVPVLQDVYMV